MIRASNDDDYLIETDEIDGYLTREEELEIQRNHTNWKFAIIQRTVFCLPRALSKGPS
jgi:hypothetical protein